MRCTTSGSRRAGIRAGHRLRSELGERLGRLRGIAQIAGRCGGNGPGWERPRRADRPAAHRRPVPHRLPAEGLRRRRGFPERGQFDPEQVISHASWWACLRWTICRDRSLSDAAGPVRGPRPPRRSGRPQCPPGRSGRRRSAAGGYARVPGGGSSPAGRRRSARRSSRRSW